MLINDRNKRKLKFHSQWSVAKRIDLSDLSDQRGTARISITRGGSAAVSLGRVPEDREPSAKLAAENTENTEGISAPARRPAATECATRIYARVCARTTCT